MICSATPEVVGNRPIDRVREAGDLDDVDVGVVRAVYGVAETGSVWLTEAEFRVNTLGFLAQHLVVLLDPSRDRGQPAPRLSRARAIRCPVRRIHDRAVGDCGHRRRADPRRAGHSDVDGRSRRPVVAYGADDHPRRHL